MSDDTQTSMLATDPESSRGADNSEPTPATGTATTPRQWPKSFNFPAEVRPGAHNQLNEIGEKIFLDRYAYKDGTKKSLKVADTVIVCTNLETGQREIGVVQKIAKDVVTVKLRDGSVVERSRDFVDKPLETDPAQMLDRVARAAASAETADDKKIEWETRFRWLVDDFKFVPAGRILAGAGTDQQLTFYNCYVIPSPKDSREGIIDNLKTMNEIFSRGGGVGMNLSSLRPRYSYVKGVNGRSSGAVSWGSLYSFSTGLIEQGGSRRGALMLILNVWHPDVLEFITSKTEAGKITNANISVGVTDDFMAAVDADADWELVFPDMADKSFYETNWDGNLGAWRAKGGKVIVYKTVRAKDVWNSIIQSAWASAEPGLFFIDRANAASNSHYFAPLISTNPCGEQPLPAWAVCNLGAINLSRFVDEPKHEVAWDLLKTSIHYAIRFLDNIIDATPYFFKENEEQQRRERRVGMNTMGLAEMMIRLGKKYGSTEGNQFVEQLYEFIATEAYRASTDLAAEKGAFPEFKAAEFLKSGYMKAMPKQVREWVKTKGIRNVTLLTQAPNGTIGTMVGTSTGIEPFYSWTYHRKSRLGIHEERVAIVEEWQAAHPGESLPDYFVNAMNLSPEEHIGVQATIQRWVDSAISKTCNVPNSYTQEQVGALYKLMYQRNCKGGTVYRDGSRDVQVLNLKQDEPVVESATVNVPSFERRPRPDVIHGTTYKMATAYGSMYVTINSDAQGQPFEVFSAIGKAGGFFAAQMEAITRLISLSLQWNVSIEDVIDQLKGIRGPNPIWADGKLVLSMPDAIAQVLERHIHRDQQPLELQFHPGSDSVATPAQADVQAVMTELQTSAATQLPVTDGVSSGSIGLTTGAKSISIADTGFAPACPDCGEMLQMSEGCMQCGACGYSKCG
jgi:ribonucleoside-diphosphate reductase alpha chain